MIVIGEKLNATIPKIREAIIAGDEETIKNTASVQAPLCDYIDVNVGTGHGNAEDEPEMMKWMIGLVRTVTDKPLMIDSTNPNVLAKALEIEKGAKKPIVNSISAESARIKDILPLVVEAEVDVVALAMDDKGIPDSVEGRLAAAKAAYDEAVKAGVQPESIHFDPLIIPVSTDPENGRIALETIGALKREFPPCKIIIGLSNAGFGLPKRPLINRSFMALALGAGADGAICDPLDKKLLATVYTVEAILGKDKWCRAYSQAARKGKLDD